MYYDIAEYQPIDHLLRSRALCDYRVCLLVIDLTAICFHYITNDTGRVYSVRRCTLMLQHTTLGHRATE